MQLSRNEDSGNRRVVYDPDRRPDGSPRCGSVRPPSCPPGAPARRWRGAAVLNGFVIMLLSMLGEYVVRTLNAVSAVSTYHVARRVSS